MWGLFQGEVGVDEFNTEWYSVTGATILTILLVNGLLDPFLVPVCTTVRLYSIPLY